MNDERKSPAEGVTKFEARHTHGPLSKRAAAMAPLLLSWRDRLFAVGGIGQDPARYDGAGYGNVSVRLSTGEFVISGTQTQMHPRGQRDDFALVTASDVEKNRVISSGPTPPSSEAMTHHAIYSATDRAGAVVHIHSPMVFARRSDLGLAAIERAVPYGTPQMAKATMALAADDVRAFVMLGHQDGVVVWAGDLDAAAQATLDLIAAAAGYSSERRGSSSPTES